MSRTRRMKLVSATPFVAIVIGLLGSLTHAAPPEQQLPVRVKKYVYRTVGDVKLNLFVYDVRETNKKESDKSEPRAAIVFFFGGGWRSGNVRQFQPHAEYLARRGMVKADNRCELKTYPGQPHGFFNYRNGKNPYYDRTVAEMTRFLKELGCLPQ